MQTLKDKGFSMPAEWAGHRGTILTWPQKKGCSFPPPYDRGVHETYVTLIELLSAVEEVHVNHWDREEMDYVRGLLKASKCNLKQVFQHLHQSYEPWCRDHGPIMVRHEKTGQVMATDWHYNAWGGKYPPYDLDNRIPALMAGVLGVECHAVEMVLEGGSIEVNGRGDLITTESCLLNPNRNPDLTRADIEKRLIDFLGVERIHWLESGIEGDDTDGHIDDLSRFVDGRRIVTVIEKNRDDPNAAVLEANRRKLLEFRDGEGAAFEVIDLPMPDAVIREGIRLPASYANFYIANGLVIVPVFGQPSDDVAVGILTDCFPGREVRGVDSRALIWGLGSFHCITQQIPA